MRAALRRWVQGCARPMRVIARRARGAGAPLTFPGTCVIAAASRRHFLHVPGAGRRQPTCTRRGDRRV
ncbi:hypothetical protein FHY16_001038 [Xanthomonas campestris]|nr:hypothetical protein [Xanthomonas euroxanthea]